MRAPSPSPRPSPPVGEREKTRVVFVTGSDTGVGKTVLTALLTRRLRAAGIGAVALKPLCSGGREDAV
ncbi:MAG: AAA family ATPase, partial [Limisphaerales bacterium]